MNAIHRLIVAGTMFGMLTSCGGSGGEPKAPDPAPVSQPQPTASSMPGYEVVQVADGGTITGTISLSGPAPKLPARPVSKDPTVCGAGARESLQLLVGKSGGLKNTVVMIEGIKAGKPMPVTSQTPRIDQDKCEYTPHVQVALAGTDIAIVNNDPILHNIHFYQNDSSLFNIAQPVKGQVNAHKLEKPGFVYAECDVHSWMQGHIAVVNNPYYALTDENGKFSISDVPPGMYKLKIWHEYLGEQTQDVAVGGKSEVAVNIDVKDLLARKHPAVITAAPSANSAAGAAAEAKNAVSRKEVSVMMHSEGGTFTFEPAAVTIKVGTTVKWINMSENRHTATDDPEFEHAAGMAILPAGVQPWSSAFLPDGESFTHTFTVPGKYQYFCRNHGQFGMVGTITVVP